MKKWANYGKQLEFNTVNTNIVLAPLEVNFDSLKIRHLHISKEQRKWNEKESHIKIFIKDYVICQDIDYSNI